MLKKILWILFIGLLIQTAQAYTIEGDSVIIEDAQVSLRVTPHTAISAVNRYEQTFELCNKTGVETTVFAGYIFDEKLTSGKVEFFQKPVYNWIEKEKNCPYSFNYILNEDSDQNPHKAICFNTVDENGTDINKVYWEQEFKTGNPTTGTLQYDVNSLISGNTWLDVTNQFTGNYTVLPNGKSLYPFTAGKTFQANTCQSWKINYKPGNPVSGKWDLWLWAGSSWNCILNDSCTKTKKLDPWYSNPYGFKYPLNSMVISVDQNSTNWLSLESVDLTAMTFNCNDANDFIIVNEPDQVEVTDFNLQGWDGTSTDSDVNILFRLTEAITADTYNGEYYFYTNNTSSCAISSARTYYQSAYDGFEDGAADTINADSPFWYELYGSGESFDAITDAKKVGDYGMKPISPVQQVGTNIYPDAQGIVQSCMWLYATDLSDTVAFGFNDQPTVNYNLAFFDLQIQRCGSGAGADSCGAFTSASTSTWYNVCIKYDGVKEYYTIRDTAGIVLGSAETAAGTANINVGRSFIRVDLGYLYVDNVGYKPPTTATYTVGSAEENTAAPDVNVWQVNGYDLNAALPLFGTGSTLAITISVFDSDNDRLTLDLNFSKSTDQGTGTKIEDDLNLTLAMCEPDDWETEVSSCTINVDASALADGNWFVNALVSDGTSTAFDYSDNNIGLDSTMPTIGTIVLNDFLFSETGNFIDGSGTIHALVSDNIAIVSCEYQSTVGNWVTGTYDGSYCTSGTIQIANKQYYAFNIRATDTAGNIGNGVDVNYTGKTVLVDATAITDDEFRNLGFVAVYTGMSVIGLYAFAFVLIIVVTGFLMYFVKKKH